MRHIALYYVRQGFRSEYNTRLHSLVWFAFQICYKLYQSTKDVNKLRIFSVVGLFVIEVLTFTLKLLWQCCLDSHRQENLIGGVYFIIQFTFTAKLILRFSGQNESHQRYWPLNVDFRLTDVTKLSFIFSTSIFINVNIDVDTEDLKNLIAIH